MTVAEEIGLLAVSVVVVAMVLFWIATRAHLDEEDPEKEKPGFKHGLRQGLRFLLGPFPLSIGLHVVVLLFLLFAVHMETGQNFIPISLQAGGGGGQTKPGEDTNMPEMQMPELQALPMERPKQVDAYAREAVVSANNYVRSTNSGIGIGRGGGMGSGYGQGIGNGFGGFISGLRRTGLDVVIVIDGTGSMRLVIDDVKRQDAPVDARDSPAGADRAHRDHRLRRTRRADADAAADHFARRAGPVPGQHPGAQRRRMAGRHAGRGPDGGRQHGMALVRQEGDRAGRRHPAVQGGFRPGPPDSFASSTPRTEPSIRST